MRSADPDPGPVAPQRLPPPPSPVVTPAATESGAKGPKEKVKLASAGPPRPERPPRAHEATTGSGSTGTGRLGPGGLAAIYALAAASALTQRKSENVRTEARPVREHCLESIKSRTLRRAAETRRERNTQSQQARKHAATACPVGQNYRYGGTRVSTSMRAKSRSVVESAVGLPLGCRLEAVLICLRD